MQRQRREVRPDSRPTRRSRTSSRSSPRSRTCTRRAALLRLQARQRDPGRRHDQAHRPRRRAARRRRPSRDLRHGRLPGARGRRRRAERRRATSSRSGAPSPCSRWSSAATRATYVATLPPVDDTPLFQRYDSLYRLLREGDRARIPTTGSSPPTSCATSCSACCARSWRSTAASAAAAHSNPSTLFGAPTGAGAELAGRICRCCGSIAPTRRRLARRRVARGRRQRLEVLEQAPAADRRGAAREGARRDRRRAASPSRTRSVNDVLTDNPWEWRAVWLSGLAPWLAPTSRPPRPRSTPCSGRCPASSRPSSRSRSRARQTGDDRRRRVSSTRSVPRPTPTTSRRRRSAWPAPARTAGDVAGSLDALDLVAPTSGAYVAARRRRAELLTAAGARPRRRSRPRRSVENIAIDPRDRLIIRRARLHRGDRRGRTGRRRTGERRSAESRPRETDLRAAAERAYRDLAGPHVGSRASASVSSTQANAVRPRTLV